MRYFFILLLSMTAFAWEVHGESTWDWKPVWREPADCGPNALYILMKIEGYSVTLEEVKALIPLDPVQGCSMEMMIHAAAQLGFDLESRFVRPGDMHKLQRPFILHGYTNHEKNQGHFAVIIDYKRKNRSFGVINPIGETFTWNPESSVRYDCSGYVLVPKYTTSQKWNTIAGTSLIICSLVCLYIVYVHRQSLKMHNQTTHMHE